MVRDFLRMRGDTLPIPGIAPLGAAQPRAIIARAALSQGVNEKRALQRSVESTPE